VLKAYTTAFPWVAPLLAASDKALPDLADAFPDEDESELAAALLCCALLKQPAQFIPLRPA
jgi:hypothetical protein